MTIKGRKKKEEEEEDNDDEGDEEEGQRIANKRVGLYRSLLHSRC